MKNIKEIYQAPVAEVQLFNTTDIMVISTDDYQNDIEWTFVEEDISW